MKKLGIVSLFLFFSLLTLNAQAPLGKGGRQFNAGFGFSDWGVPIYMGLDFGVHRDVTLGIEGSYRSYYDYGYHSSIFGFSGNGNYHFNTILDIPHNWDFYAGLNLGFYVWSSPSGYHGSHSSGLGLGGQIGARYFFTPKFGINLEFGGGNAFSGGKFGITVKI
jgi:outer membrane immunogenic protein